MVDTRKQDEMSRKMPDDKNEGVDGCTQTDAERIINKFRGNYLTIIILYGHLFYGCN